MRIDEPGVKIAATPEALEATYEWLVSLPWTYMDDAPEWIVKLQQDLEDMFA